MTILVLNGPNLNMLGKRVQTLYGTLTLDQITTLLAQEATKLGATLSFFQSNHEGALIDFLQQHAATAQGIMINPGALTHYGYALRDALVDTQLPIVEVHLSNILEREPFRRIDVLDGIVIERVMGKKEQSYLQGLQTLVTHIQTAATS